MPVYTYELFNPARTISISADSKEQADHIYEKRLSDIIREEIEKDRQYAFEGNGIDNPLYK